MRSATGFPASLIAFASTLALAAVALAQSGRYAIQIEASHGRAEAEASVEHLRAQGVDAYLVESLIPDKGRFFRVRAGDFSTPAAAEEYGQQLEARGTIREFFVATYEAPQPEAAPEASEPGLTLTVKPPESDEPAPVPALPRDATTSTAISALDASPATTWPGNESSEPGDYVLYQDADVGYSFEYPRHWVGRQLGERELRAQKITAGAMFKSNRDATFLSAIWNRLDGANSPDQDNDAVVDRVLESLASGEGTRSLEAVSRRVVRDGPRIKTFLDLEAAFQVSSQPAPLEFQGKGVIIRASRGVLLLVAFYSESSPPAAVLDADRIVQSAQTPD
jgi:hypothetical protein